MTRPPSDLTQVDSTQVDSTQADLIPADLTQADDFVRRHIGPSEADVADMLDTLGFDSLQDLVAAAVPGSILLEDTLDLPGPRTERAVVERLRELAAGNELHTSMIGMGYHGTITPAVIRRNILENPGWYTAYTPYQAEISQGRLEALLNFQTMIIELTGMEIANASLLDEATAAAEAMTMLHRTGRSGSDRFLVDADCHPQTIAVLRTRAAPLGIEVVVGDPRGDVSEIDPYGVLLQYPGSSGEVPDDTRCIAALADRGVGVAVAADLLALTLLTPPGEMGADVVVGTTQRFGVPMMFGGPHAAYFATRNELKRSLPGRLVGVSKDAEGRLAFRLALTTREQHIRRERATSNICTAQVLLAIIAGAYAVYHGPEGLRTIAERTHRLTSILAAALVDGGHELVNDTWFDTLTVRTSGPATAVIDEAASRGIDLRPAGERTVGISLDETTTVDDVARVLAAFGIDSDPRHREAPDGIPGSLRRTSEYLTHPVFHHHRTETEMLRYLRRLQHQDIALDRSMIPLGSCTLKLNATTEMLAITWPEFADIHPFAPRRQVGGYLELIDELERWLAELTGYDAVSLQPNAGSQGEYAGLLAIRGYHESRGEGHRDVCLIPASAHGTNPASAAMTGLRVVVVDTDEAGNIDIEDLRVKAAGHADRLAALMITYPSTHGVFEEGVREVCEIVHRHGGQVYIDGANLNALLGVAKLGELGGDVSHLNLHKTFTIPHGGGGPGVGPIGVLRHLEPFLPGNPLASDPPGSGPVAAAPWGSAGILPISWAYIALMGGSGLTRATQVAILSANYVAKRLEDHYPVLYTGRNGLVAHECILDVRGFKRSPGVTVDDFAKRLIDYGFHAPTMSFPVTGTLMVEPTESEPRHELDRFVDAMIAISGEVDRITAGEWPVEDNPLVNAPHPAENVVADEWSHPYLREIAAYPVPGSRGDKYWPPVSRIDNAYGDRNLVCACPPIETYQ